MKKKTIVSRILVALLALLLILSLILPAFAAEEDSAPASSSNTTGAATYSVTAFLQGFLSPSPLHIIIVIAAMALVFLTSYLITRSIEFVVYKYRAKKMMAEYANYVQLTGLDYKLVMTHFSEFAGSCYHTKTIQRHFLEELYSLFLQKKSEELAAKDECADKDKTHLIIRAEVYRKRLEKNYPYTDFLNLLPLDADTACLL